MQDTLRRIDKGRLTPKPGEIFGFACVRNEDLRLPHFLDYHRALGVDRFFVVDNASTDGTTETLLAQSDVHVFLTDQSYAEGAFGVDWLNSLLAEFAEGHWALSLDADELLVYPHCEQLGLRRLTDVLEQRKEQALLTFLLDMYADSPLRDAFYSRGKRFLDACPHFDAETYDRSGGPTEFKQRVPVRGGVRQRLFWQGRDLSSSAPVLHKVPLVFWRSGLAYTVSTHRLEGVRFARGLTGALLHFKLFADFARRAVEEVERGEHWENGGQYSVYSEVLQRDPALNPSFGGSVRYRDSRQLVELGLMELSWWVGRRLRALLRDGANA